MRKERKHPATPKERKVRCRNQACNAIITKSERRDHLKQKHPIFYQLINSKQSKELGSTGRIDIYFVNQP